jgi:type IV pilus assembly protein PilB
MVVFCKRCGSPVKLENARLTDPAYKVNCQKCQRAVAMDTIRPASGGAIPGRQAPAASPVTPAAGPVGAAAGAQTAEEHASAPDKSHYLQKIRLFSGLPYDECRVIESHLRTQEFPPQQTIVPEGGPGDAMYFITSGAVEVRKRDPNSGIDFLLSELKAGSCFGEMALLTGRPRVASVVAVEPTTCSVLDQSAFDEMLLSSPKLGPAMSIVLAERLGDADQQTGIEYVNLARLHFDPRIIKLLPPAMMKQHRVLPVAFSNNRLTLAMVNPNNQAALDDVRRVIKGVMIEPVVTSEDDFKRFIATAYAELVRKEAESQGREQGAKAGQGTAAAKARESASPGAPPDSAESIIESLQSETQKSLEMVEGPQSPDGVTDLSFSAQDTPFIRMANTILALAIKKGASDIHLEPQEKDLTVRFRIDGALHVMQVLPKKIQMGLISRFKTISKLDTAEKRLPQDGRIAVRLEDRPIDFRVSTIPSKWGEKICMRVIDKSNTLVGLDKLILHQEALELVREMISQPYGIIYVTGPTGSGKTTTLYGALAELDNPDVNISTAEDPIAYDLPRANQVQAQKEIGLDYPRILRAFLRQDPDIILVGETRDKETAHIAVEAALTGHLVFTTLRTNDAAGVFARLDEMGIEPFLMASSTIGVIAQRLTRRLCPDCKQSYTPDDIALNYLGLDPNKQLTFYRHRGCDKCSGTGYRGRVGVYEVLRMNAELRRLVAGGGTSEAISALAVKQGMKTLKDYSVWLLQNGWISMDEVLQAVSVQE